MQLCAVVNGTVHCDTLSTWVNWLSLLITNGGMSSDAKLVADVHKMQRTEDLGYIMCNMATIFVIRLRIN